MQALYDSGISQVHEELQQVATPFPSEVVWGHQFVKEWRTDSSTQG